MLLFMFLLICYPLTANSQFPWDLQRKEHRTQKGSAIFLFWLFILIMKDCQHLQGFEIKENMNTFYYRWPSPKIIFQDSKIYIKFSTWS